MGHGGPGQKRGGRGALTTGWVRLSSNQMHEPINGTDFRIRRTDDTPAMAGSYLAVEPCPAKRLGGGSPA